MKATTNPGNHPVARARCARCENEISVTAHEPSLALAALHDLLRRYGWSLDRQGRRLCPDHAPIPEEQVA